MIYYYIWCFVQYFFVTPLMGYVIYFSRYSDGKTPVVTPLNVTFSGHFGQQTDVSTLSTAVRIPISSIPDQKKV